MEPPTRSVPGNKARSACSCQINAGAKDQALDVRFGLPAQPVDATQAVASFRANPTSLVASKMSRPGFRIVLAKALLMDCGCPYHLERHYPAGVAKEINVCSHLG